MNIRMISVEDAQQFLELNMRLDRETQFMLLEPEERANTVEQIKARIEGTLKRSNEAVFVLEENKMLVGYASIIGGFCRRNQHKASIVTGILQSHVGKGYGTLLFTALMEWAKNSPLHRIELSVMTHNKRAIALYKKFGFEIEGTQKDSLFVDHSYVDEFMMALIIK